MNVERFQHDFMNRIRDPWQFSSLLDNLPDVCFFLKTRDSRFVMANRHFLALLGVASIREAAAKTDTDFFEYGLASRYIEEDLKVIEGKDKVQNRLWLIPHLKQGTVSSFRCTKMQVHSATGSVIGLAGILRFETSSHPDSLPCDRMARVVEYMSRNFQEKLTIQTLAALVHMSERQFERRFAQVLHASPLQHLIKIRIGAACHFLQTTNRTLTDIAQEVGFCDHAYFCRQFKKSIGVTPGQYRESRGLAVMSPTTGRNPQPR